MQIFKKNNKISKQTENPSGESFPIKQKKIFFHKRIGFIHNKKKLSEIQKQEIKENIEFLNAFDKLKQKDINQINLKIQVLQKDLDEKTSTLKILKSNFEKSQQEKIKR